MSMSVLWWSDPKFATEERGGVAGYSQGEGAASLPPNQRKPMPCLGKEDPRLKGLTLDAEAKTFRGELGTNGTKCGCWPLS